MISNRYCVRPNSGRIDAGKDVEVQVLLQAMKEDPPLDTKCRDKFLVQSVAIKAENETNVSQIWSNIEQNAKSSIQERKIRVTFLPADGQSGGDVAAPAAAAAGGELIVFLAALGVRKVVCGGVRSEDASALRVCVKNLESCYRALFTTVKVTFCKRSSANVS